MKPKKRMGSSGDDDDGDIINSSTNYDDMSN
jgi:hypothetical protein